MKRRYKYIALFICIISIFIFSFPTNQEKTKGGAVIIAHEVSENKAEAILLAFPGKGDPGADVSLFVKLPNELWRWYYVDHECISLSFWKLKTDVHSNQLILTHWGKEISVLNLNNMVYMRNGRIHATDYGGGPLVISKHPTELSHPFPKWRSKELSRVRP